jgi:hypothetical protein
MGTGTTKAHAASTGNECRLVMVYLGLRGELTLLGILDSLPGSGMKNGMFPSVVLSVLFGLLVTASVC